MVGPRSSDAEAGVEREDGEARHRGDLPRTYCEAEKSAVAGALNEGRNAHRSGIGARGRRRERFVTSYSITSRLNLESIGADIRSVLLTAPFARTALLLVLAALATALMLIRVSASQPQGADAPTSPMVSLASHTPGSAAHERHEYRLRVAQAIAASGG